MAGKDSYERDFEEEVRVFEDRAEYYAFVKSEVLRKLRYLTEGERVQMFRALTEMWCPLCGTEEMLCPCFDD